jgi:micrococcal nuclease
MMRKILYAAVVIAAILGLATNRTLPKRLQNAPASTQPAAASVSAQSLTPTAPDSPKVFYPVIKVVDGDTLAVNIGGKNTTIRLIGLDTPETVDPRKPVQCFGMEASKKAKELLTGKRVRIEADPSQGELDKYGRMLAYVFLEDGTLFNKLMISEGYGHEYTYNIPYKYKKEFKEAETDAREEKKGLWAPQACQSQASQIIAEKPTQIDADIAYDCSRNAYNCPSFKTQAEAQYVFELCGGDQNDIHRLDSDKDGKVCESLP